MEREHRCKRLGDVDTAFRCARLDAGGAADMGAVIVGPVGDRIVELIDPRPVSGVGCDRYHVAAQRGTGLTLPTRAKRLLDRRYQRLRLTTNCCTLYGSPVEVFH